MLALNGNFLARYLARNVQRGNDLRQGGGHQGGGLQRGRLTIWRYTEALVPGNELDNICNILVLKENFFRSFKKSHCIS